ncbi:MAG: DUF1592 domain-containing protein [Verrucomicrobia subdivision 3 bacterium]|nr:DUF1592 domain-containing protein [Limisphaerales bacterium]
MIKLLRKRFCIPLYAWAMMWSAEAFGIEAKRPPRDFAEVAQEHFEQYCFDCHDGETKKGGLDLTQLLERDGSDGALVFENLITAKMPPANKKQPKAEERQLMLQWLAQRQKASAPKSFRRISRHEFVNSANDLLGVKLDLTGEIPEDRGTRNFDSDRRVQLTKEMLTAYFTAVDDLLEFALPAKGFEPERVWVTSKLKDSHKSYNIYTRPYEDGILFSWTRANNGNSYSFFYDNFDPPVPGWYELTFDALKLGAFPEDVSLMVYAGKYYYADDRPQPQRLLDVISLGNREMKSHTIRAFLRPDENVSVHCYSRHNFRQQNGKVGAYIKQLKARGPVHEQWPPQTYRDVFAGLPLQAPPREAVSAAVSQTKLKAIGGRITVSSFQKGMEKERMQDGSNRTFWHTRFKPTLAKPPHFVVLENPKGKSIDGLSYATWSGGNGNGQVKAYAIYVSDDGKSWGKPVLAGNLEIRLANEQPIVFPKPIAKRFIKFLITDAFTIDGRSLASIGKLDVMTALPQDDSTLAVSVVSESVDELKRVIRRFAERAFASSLTEAELAPYYAISLAAFREQGDFVAATRLGLKAVLGSHRFLMAPGEHANASYAKAAALSRVLWLSVPDAELLRLAKVDQLEGKTLAAQIDRLLQDPRSARMIHSFCDQWLNLREFNKVSPSLKLYPIYDDLLNRYLPKETEAYLNHLIQENLSVSHLIDSDFSFLNQRLAQHYGIDGVIGQQMRKVTFAPEVPRGGLLTMGSILKVTADGFETSPIRRGAWVSKTIAGNTLSPPPESVKAIEPDHGPAAATLREQIEQHKNNAACFACHKSIDPYGFALESFDATGQWRTQYRIKLPHRGTFQYRPKGYFKLTGNVDAAGEVGRAKFEDVFGLKKILLSKHRKVAYNFAKTFFEYANGYTPNLQQRLHLYAMIPAEADACGMKDLIRQVLVYSLEGEAE